MPFNFKKTNPGYTFLLFAAVVFIIGCVVAGIDIVFKGGSALYEQHHDEMFGSTTTTLGTLRFTFVLLVIAIVYFLYCAWKEGKKSNNNQVKDKR